jgi:hypothetical protein
MRRCPAVNPPMRHNRALAVDVNIGARCTDQRLGLWQNKLFGERLHRRDVERSLALRRTTYNEYSVIISIPPAREPRHLAN